MAELQFMEISALVVPIDNTTEVIELKDLQDYQRQFLSQLIPDLQNFVIHCRNKQAVDVDFYFKDDPNLDNPDYCGTGLTEFIYNSKTYRSLVVAVELACIEKGIINEH